MINEIKYDGTGSRWQRSDFAMAPVYFFGEWMEWRNNQPVRLVYAQGIDNVLAEVAGATSPTTETLLTDPSGNVVHTATAGALASTRRYEAFGTVRTQSGATGLERGFASRPAEGGSGLVYMRARHYDTATGRFLQADPLGIDADQMYAYGAHNPVVYSDPSGLLPIKAANVSLSGPPPSIAGGSPTSTISGGGLVGTRAAPLHPTSVAPQTVLARWTATWQDLWGIEPDPDRDRFEGSDNPFGVFIHPSAGQQGPPQFRPGNSGLGALEWVAGGGRSLAVGAGKGVLKLVQGSPRAKRFLDYVGVYRPGLNTAGQLQPKSFVTGRFLSNNAYAAGRLGQFQYGFFAAQAPPGEPVPSVPSRAFKAGYYVGKAFNFLGGLRE